MATPRRAHYQLAHVALRSVAFRDPYAFLSLMASEQAREALDSLIEQVAEHCPDEPPDFDVDDLTLHRERVLGSPCLVIEMPAPVAPPEAHFVAVWLAINDGPEAEKMRYFALESADPAFGTPSVLSEWTADGQHVNHAGGCEPNVEAFLAAITARVARYH